MPPSAAHPPVVLRRALNLPLFTLYGLGVTVGAGIYVLIGTTAALAGGQAWLSFVLAAIVVGFTAFSFAELSTRFPVSAGEAAYVEAGLNRPGLAFIVGLLVAASGMISAAAICVGASGYLSDLTHLPAAPLIVGIVAAMAVLAWWGIAQSVLVAAVITVLEVCGLGFVIFWGLVMAPADGLPPAQLLPTAGSVSWAGIAGASLLAFFAFIGFEDMVNVAEEVQNPRDALPKGIILTLVLAAILYVATCIAVLLSVPMADLAGSNAPLTLVFASAPAAVQNLFSALAVVATINGVLIQMIMASRVLYGLAKRGRLPAVLASLSPRRQTPGAATALVSGCILILALLLPIEQLAAWTSVIVLSVFTVVNLSLIGLKWRGEKGGDHFAVPVIVPILGVITSLAMLATSLL